MGQLNNNNMEVDYVQKRDGEIEEMSFEKVLTRIKTLSKDLNVNPTKITQQICTQLYNKIPTDKIDELSAQLCASHATEHPDYVELASRIEISNLHKNTSPSFSETIRILYEHNSLVSKSVYDIVEKNKTKLNSYIKYRRDNLIDFFGIKTLSKSYLMKVNGKIIERPQHLFMRVAIGIHQDDLKEALKTYDLMSEKYFIHATPTLFNSGTPRPQLSSCFLLSMRDDSIDHTHFISLLSRIISSKKKDFSGFFLTNHFRQIRRTVSTIKTRYVSVCLFKNSMLLARKCKITNNM